MAGFQVVEPSAGDTEWGAFSTMINDIMQGFMALSLTNWDTTDVPAIAAGAKVEIAGSLYGFASTESITGSPNTSEMNYIMLTTSSSSVTASYTTSPPTWVESKNGWYDSSTGVKRYVGGMGKTRNMKWQYDQGRDNIIKHTIPTGVWDMDDTSFTFINVAHGIGDITKVKNVDVQITKDDNSAVYNLAVANDILSGSYQIDDDNFLLKRITGAFFDNLNFNSTSVNRGYITVWHEV